ncbi:MAG: hypothetical protein K2M57_06405 [Paramuribaculum sp.]|nr:hypothetical protein [Paramuribaculum sp.]
MNRLLFTLLFAFIGLTAPISIIADELALQYESTDDDDIIVGDNNRRNRMPPARVICDIDLEAGTITGASPLLADISRYEIWNEEGEICLHESDSAAAMTAALRGLGAGSYRVRLVGQGYALVGIVTL